MKELYCQNNQLSNIEGIRRFKFLQVLLIGDNQLRDLDVFLEFLAKFAFLEQLDLFGNPLAEEPDYRLKIIKAMPQIKILDRHKVTPIERTKAEALAEQNRQLAAGKSPTKAARGAGGADAMKGFSKGERDLYREVAKIKGHQEQQRLEEVERTRAVSTQACLACKLVWMTGFCDAHLSRLSVSVLPAEKLRGTAAARAEQEGREQSALWPEH